MPDIMKVEYNVRVLQEAQSLQRSGYEVYVVGFSNKTKSRHFTINGIKVVSFYLHDARKGKEKILRLFSALNMILRINLFIIFYKANIYHAHNFHVLPACFFSALFHKGKLVYETHETWTIHRKQKCHPEHIFALIIETIFLRFISAFITVNEMVAQYYVQKYHIKNPLVLYNTRRMLPLKRKNLIRKKINIEKSKKIILFVGGFWASGRGIMELIRSSQYLDEKFAIALLGYGSDNMITNMEKEITKWKAQNKVYLLPPKPPDKVMDYVMSADIGVNLIKHESEAQDFQSPWKLFEYCMAGLAVVSTDLPFHQKVHKKYKIGPLVSRNNNPKNIALVVNDLIKEPEKLSLYKKNARKAAETEYNWENQEKKLLFLYKQLGV